MQQLAGMPEPSSDPILDRGVALIRASPSELTESLGISFATGYEEFGLGAYEVAWIRAEDEHVFLIIRYEGDPARQVCIHCQQSIMNDSRPLAAFLRELHIDDHQIRWVHPDMRPLMVFYPTEPRG